MLGFWARCAKRALPARPVTSAVAALLLASAACGQHTYEPTLSASQALGLIPEQWGVGRSIGTTREILSATYLPSGPEPGVWFIHSRVFIGLNALGYTEGSERDAFFLVNDRSREIAGPCYPVPAASELDADELTKRCN